MEDESKQPATKKDLVDLEGVLRSDMNSMKDDLRSEMSSVKDELRSDMSSMKDELTQVFDTKLMAEIGTLRSEFKSELDTVKDQIIRAIRMEAENIFKQCAHRDELADNTNRIDRIERHLGLQEN